MLLWMQILNQMRFCKINFFSIFLEGERVCIYVCCEKVSIVWVSSFAIRILPISVSINSALRTQRKTKTILMKNSSPPHKLIRYFNYAVKSPSYQGTRMTWVWSSGEVCQGTIVRGVNMVLRMLQQWKQ